MGSRTGSNHRFGLVVAVVIIIFSTYNAFLFCDTDIRDYGLVYRLFHDNHFFYCRIATFRQRTAGVCY